MDKFRSRALSCCFLFFACALNVCAETRIGVLVPLTGEMSPFGTKALEGVELAFARYPNLKIIVEDSGSPGNKITSIAAQKLIQKDKVDLLLGLFYLDQTLVVAPLTRAAKVPFITLSLCSEEFRKFHEVACSYASTPEQMQTLHSFLKTKKLRTLGLFLDGSQYSLEAEEALKSILKQYDIEIISRIEMNPGSRDFRPILPKLLVKDPEGIFAISIDPGQAYALFRALDEQHYHGMRLGYLDIDPRYVKEFASSIEGIVLPGFIAPNFEKSFVQAFQEKHGGREPDAYIAQAYDVASTIGEASKHLPSKSFYEDILRVRLAKPAIPGFHYRSDGTVSLPLSMLTVREAKILEWSAD